MPAPSSCQSLLDLQLEPVGCQVLGSDLQFHDLKNVRFELIDWIRRQTHFYTRPGFQPLLPVLEAKTQRYTGKH